MWDDVAPVLGCIGPSAEISGSLLCYSPSEVSCDQINWSQSRSSSSVFAMGLSPVSWCDMSKIIFCTVIDGWVCDRDACPAFQEGHNTANPFGRKVVAVIEKVAGNGVCVGTW